MSARSRLHRSGSRLPRSLATGLAASLLLARPAPGRAEDPADYGRAPAAARSGDAGATRAWTFSLLGGPALPDPSLTDYQWSMTPGLAYGAEALLGAGRSAGGVRVWTARSTQEIDASATPASATVTRTSLELVGRYALTRIAGLELGVTADAGWIHLGYQPDQASIPSPGGPVEVRFAPIDTWVAGAGLGARKPLAQRWSAGLELEHRFFALDTSHRSGTTVVSERSTFGDWSARLALTRHLHW